MRKTIGTKIKLPQKMLNCINEDNLENFMDGLKYALKSYLALIKLTKAIEPSFEYKKNTDILQMPAVTYIDDGKQDNYVIITKP